MGKFGLMAGTAAIALLTAAGAQAAVANNDAAAGKDNGAATVIEARVQMAQNAMPSQSSSSSTADLEARDLRDRTRAEAPLTAAPDAVLLDTSDLGKEAAIAAAIRIVAEKTTAHD